MQDEISKELGIDDLNDPKAVEQAVTKWQKNNGFNGKNIDGVMGWATLEKLDGVITEKHNRTEDVEIKSKLVNA